MSKPYLICPACGRPLSIQKAVAEIAWTTGANGILAGRELYEPAYLVCEYVLTGIFEDVVDFAQRRAAEIEMTGALMTVQSATGELVQADVVSVKCGWRAELVTLTKNMVTGSLSARVKVAGIEQVLLSA